MVNHPEILWAQRSSEYEPEKNVLFLSICIPSLDPSYTLALTTPTTLAFTGHTTPPPATNTAAAVEPKTYEFQLELFGEVSEVKRTLDTKKLAVVLQKKDLTEDYWPRLTKEKLKLNFVKTDFSKWKDQDEQDDDEDEPEPDGPPGGGMPGGGMGGAGGMDFASMMQGMGGGAGGPGGMDMEAMMAQMKAAGVGGADGMDEDDDAPEEDDDDDDDGPPPLEEA